MTNDSILQLHQALDTQQEQLLRAQAVLRTAMEKLSVASRLLPTLKDSFKPLLALDADFDNRLGALQVLRFEVDTITGDDEMDAIKGHLQLLRHPFTAPARTVVSSLLN